MASQGNTECTSCEAAIAEMEGSTECQTCFAGSGPNANKDACENCAPGRYSESGVCEECAGGTYQETEGSTECYKCWPGTYSSTDRTACVECPAGRYSDTEGTAVCAACPRGRESEWGFQCINCLAGRYSLAGDPNCSSCPGGTYSGEESFQCTQCDLGKISFGGEAQCNYCDMNLIANAAQDDCTPCPAGQSKNDPSATSCSACADGEVSEAGGFCNQCFPGTFMNSNRTACEECPAGKVAINWGSTECEACPAGEVPSQDPWESCFNCYCEACPSGSIPGTNSSCVECGAGKYASDSGDACTNCPAGTYSNTTGLFHESQCETCPGQTTAADGATSIDMCIQPGVGQYFQCVRGKVCEISGFEGVGLESTHQVAVKVEACAVPEPEPPEPPIGYYGPGPGGGYGPEGYGSGTGDDGSSGTGDFGSGTGSSGSGTTGSGDGTGGSGTGDFGSGTGSFGSGTGSSGSGTTGSGDGTGGSGTGDFGSGTGSFGSGTTGTGDFGTGDFTGGFGSGTGSFGSGTGTDDSGTDGGTGTGAFGYGSSGDDGTGSSGGPNNADYDNSSSDVNGTGSPGNGGGPDDGNGSNHTGGGHVPGIGDGGGSPHHGGSGGPDNETDSNYSSNSSPGDGGGPPGDDNHTGHGPGPDPGDGPDTGPGPSDGPDTGPGTTTTTTTATTTDGSGPGSGPDTGGGTGPGTGPSGPDPGYGDDYDYGGLPRRMQEEEPEASLDTSAVSGFGTDSISSQGSTNYSWSSQLDASPGQYVLCWCGGVGGETCDSLDKFATDVGIIKVLGPYPNQLFVCTKGHICLEPGPVFGVGLTDQDLIQRRMDCTLDQAQFFGSEMKVRAEQNSTTNETVLYFTSPQAIHDGAGEYALCWCSSVGSTCSSMRGTVSVNVTDYVEARIGTLELHGPPTGEEAECNQGQVCAIELVGYTTGLLEGDRITALEQCGFGDFIDGLPSPGYADTSEGTYYEFDSTNVSDGNDLYLMSSPGIFRLCWCRPAPALSLYCNKGVDFNVTVGLFRSVGPYSGQELFCAFGSQCVVTGLRGISLSSANLLLPSGSCDNQVGTINFPQLQPVAISYNETTGDAYYDLGFLPLQNSTPEQLWVCWCAGGPACANTSSFRVTALALSVECPPGWYELHGATVTCQECLPGYYCSGGNQAQMQKCPVGMTSFAAARGLEECVCRRGYFWNVQLSACFACPSGAFQDATGRLTGCPGECPPGTTSSTGAASLTECYCAGNTLDVDPAPEGFECVDLLLLANNFSNSTKSFAAREAALFTFSGSLRVLDASSSDFVSSILEALSDRLELTDSTRASFSIGVRWNESWYIDCQAWSPDPELAETMRGRFESLSFGVWIASEMAGTTLASAVPDFETPVQAMTLQCPEGLGLQAGEYVTGIADCQCPHGMQPAVTGSTGLLDGCTSCPVGTYKSSVGDSICVACPSGNIPLTTLQQGAISYAACTCSAGFVNTDPEDPAACASCGEGSYCPGGGLKLSCEQAQTTADDTAKSQSDCLCEKGFTGTGVGACEACVPGRFKEEVGNLPCMECPAGQFSEEGADECDSCDEGTFSTAGMGTCEPCPAGRYSEAEEATSLAACVMCETGKWSDEEGASKPSTCISCVDGSTTRQSGAQNESFCVRPDPDQLRQCISGRACAVDEISGSYFQNGHRMGLAVADCSAAKVAVPSVTNSGITDLASNSGKRYVFGDEAEDFAPFGGYYNMCWCANIGDLTCEDLNSNFLISAGQLHVIGPSQNLFECVRGRDCLGLEPFLGFGLLANDFIAVRRDQCGLAAEMQLSADNQDGKGNFTSNGTHLALGFGTSRSVEDYYLSVDADDGGYALCWCAGSRGLVDACGNPEDYQVFAGRLRVVGPRTNQESECFVGQACAVTGIRGVSMAAGDRMMILSNCGKGTALPGFPGSGIMETSDGTNFAFAGTASSILLSAPGIFRMCFCRPSPAGEVCSAPSSFQAAVGLMTASGPFEQTTTCQLGSVCTVFLSGIGLIAGDQLLFAVGECGNSTSVGSLGYPDLQNPLAVEDGSSGLQVLLGQLPAKAVPGLYTVCWCPLIAGCTTSATFRAPAGYLQVNCPAGTFATGPAAGRSQVGCRS